MSVKPQYETYRYVGEICRLQGQSLVECRLPGSEISAVLAVHAKAITEESVCADGEVRYNGKVLINVVYEDGEKKVCRAERGVEFYHKVEGAAVSPACFAKTALACENVSYRREGSGVYVSVVVGADISVYGSKQIEYFSGGENIIAQKEEITVCKSVCVSGETEGEDEFEADYVGDILLHSETVLVERVSAGAGVVDIEGQINLNICVLKGDDSIGSYERLAPFKMQVPCDEAYGNVGVNARVLVKNAYLSVGTDEDKGNSKIVFTYALSADCFLTAKETLNVVSDAFSTEAELQLKRVNGEGRYLLNVAKGVERVGGVALLTPVLDGDAVLQSAVLPKAELVCKKGERGIEAEGAVTAVLIMKTAEGSYQSCDLTLPVVFPVETDAEFVEIDCMVCGLNVRRKKSGETEAEAVLKLSVRSYEQRSWTYIAEMAEGEVYERNDCAFSVFMPRVGEDLWQVAKRLRCEPEDLKKSNPNLTFPVREGEKIFVYRQIK